MVLELIEYTHKMSEEEDVGCAGCGVKEDDDIKLKRCTACYLVRYCGVECQREHRPKHKKECKKRAAELRDELLFKQPESSHLGDCPICFLPIPDDGKKNFIFMPCCGTIICDGCDHANQKREAESFLRTKCAFCRTPLTKTEEKTLPILTKRIEANDTGAMVHMGRYCLREKKFSAAFQHFTKAVALGDVESHYYLSEMYGQGLGFEKDEKKQLHHLECAVIGGSVFSRYRLGCLEEKNCRRLDRALQHWMIAAKLGCGESMTALTKASEAGVVSKENFVAVLGAHNAAVDAMKSEQREESERWRAEGRTWIVS